MSSQEPLTKEPYNDDKYEGVYILDNTPIKFEIIKRNYFNPNKTTYLIVFSDSDPEILSVFAKFFGERFFLHEGVYSLFLDINENLFEQLKTIINGRSTQSGLESTDPEYNIMNHHGQWMNAKIGGPAITEYKKSKAEAAKAAETEAAKKFKWPWQRSKTGGGIRRKPTKRRRNRRRNRKTKKI
jgi:hypothetical protein